MFYMGTNDQIMQEKGEVLQMHFPVIWTLPIWKFFLAKVDTIENKSLSVYRITEWFILEVNG